MAVANKGDEYSFASPEGKEMVADRERSWQGFTRAVVWGAGAVVLVLLLLLFFFA